MKNTFDDGYVKESNIDDHNKKQDTDIDSESDKTTNATIIGSNAMKVVDEGLLKKMSDEVSRLAQSQIEAKNERRKSDAELLQKVHDMIAKEKDTVTTQSLSVIQNTTLLLEQNNYQLMNEIKELNTKLVHEKEMYVNDTNQLNIQLQQSNEKICTLERLQNDLQNQIVMLQNEKVQSQETAREYQQLYETLQNELQQCHDQIELLKNTSNQNQEDTFHQIQQLHHEKNELQNKLQNEQESYQQLQTTIQSYTETIQKLENEIIPNLKSTMDNERDTIARLEQSNEIRQNDIDIANETIVSLQNEIQQLQNQYNTIQDTLQVCQKEYEMKLQEVNTLKYEFDEQTNEMKHQHEIDIQQLNDTNTTLQKSNDTLIVQQKQLNDALEESMIQLDHIEQEKRTIEMKLQNVMEQMNTLQNNLSATNTETTQTILQLQEELQHECQLRKDAEQIRIELDTMIRNQKNEIQTLKHELITTQQERDIARNNMDGYNERENKLYQQLVYYETIRQKLHEQLIVLLGNIRVFIRIRPKLHNEIENEQNENKEETNMKRTNNKSKEFMKQNKDTEIFRYPTIYEKSIAQSVNNIHSNGNTDITKNTIEVIAPYKDRGGLNDRQQKNTFHFDQIFTPTHTQENIWDNVEPLIQCTVDGYNVTIFAYGQTGSGVCCLLLRLLIVVIYTNMFDKSTERNYFSFVFFPQKTYTMLGEEGINEGIICRTVRKLYDEKQKIIDLSRGKSNITISVELLEIYNEKVRDLLSSNKEDLKVTSNEVVGNILVETNSVDDVLRVLQLAQSRRCVKATQSNQVSSRSHMIFTIHFQVVMEDGVTIRTGKVHICDLAGSERLSHSGANIVGVRILYICINMHTFGKSALLLEIQRHCTLNYVSYFLFHQKKFQI
jgi:kinesin family member C2/C3